MGALAYEPYSGGNRHSIDRPWQGVEAAKWNGCFMTVYLGGVVLCWVLLASVIGPNWKYQSNTTKVISILLGFIWPVILTGIVLFFIVFAAIMLFYLAVTITVGVRGK